MALPPVSCSRSPLLASLWNCTLGVDACEANRCDNCNNCISGRADTSRRLCDSDLSSILKESFCYFQADEGRRFADSETTEFRFCGPGNDSDLGGCLCKVTAQLDLVSTATTGVSSAPTNGGMNKGAAAGLSIGIIFLLISTAILVFFAVRRYRKRRARMGKYNPALEEDKFGTVQAARKEKLGDSPPPVPGVEGLI